MQLFAAFSLLLVGTALVSTLTRRYSRWPTAVAVMAIALCFSLGLFVLDACGCDVRAWAERAPWGGASGAGPRSSLLVHADAFLAFLLFAAALHVDLGRLLQQRRALVLLGVVGVLVTTFGVAACVFWSARWLGLALPFAACVVFGALAAAMDPLALRSALKHAGTGPTLETRLAGEALGHATLGFVAFSLALGAAVGAGEAASAPHGLGGVLFFLLWSVPGGVALGLGCGWIAYLLLRRADDRGVELLLTLALATGLYSLCHGLGASAPVALAAAGLLLGNVGGAWAVSERTNARLEDFWQLVSMLLSVVLLVLLGLEVLVLRPTQEVLLLAALALPALLLARFLAVAGVLLALRGTRRSAPRSALLATWVALRGGITAALALSLPAALPGRDAVLVLAYVAVLFSVLVQGTTLVWVARRSSRAE